MSRWKVCRSGSGAAPVTRLASGRRKLERAGPCALSSANDGAAAAPDWAMTKLLVTLSNTATRQRIRSEACNMAAPKSMAAKRRDHARRPILAIAGQRAVRA